MWTSQQLAMTRASRGKQPAQLLLLLPIAIQVVSRTSPCHAQGILVWKICAAEQALRGALVALRHIYVEDS